MGPPVCKHARRGDPIEGGGAMHHINTETLGLSHPPVDDHGVFPLRDRRGGVVRLGAIDLPR